MKNKTSQTAKASACAKRRVFLVDEHPVMRDHLTMVLNKSAGFVVCGEANSAADALKGIENMTPDILLTEISLGRGRNGLELIKDVTARFSTIRILVFSTHEESLYAERVLRAGASGYISKNQPTSGVLQALNRINEGELYISTHLSASIVAQFIRGEPGRTGSPMERLTDRELEVFQLIGRSRSSRQIADELCLDAKTVETYRGRIKQKLKLENATALHQQAMQWLQSGEILQCS